MGWHASSFKDRRPAKWGLTLWPVSSTPACGLAQRTGSFLVTGSDHQRVGDRVRVLKVGGVGVGDLGTQSNSQLGRPQGGEEFEL